MLIECPNCGTPHIGVQMQDLKPEGDKIKASFNCYKCLHFVEVEWTETRCASYKDEEYEQMLKDQEKEWEEEQRREAEERMRKFVETVDLPPFSS